MQFETLAAFLQSGPTFLAKGPVSVIYDEDGFALTESIAHALRIGFKSVVVISPFGPSVGDDPRVHTVRHEFRVEGFQVSLNGIISVAPPKTWLHAAFNGEFLWYPFLETRSVGELCTFHAEERRSAFFTMVIDAYCDADLASATTVSEDDVWFDGTGYFALARHDPKNPLVTFDRQSDLYGGLRWRMEELVPWERRRIDRITLFQTAKGLTMRPDHTLSEAELNTVSCPWHHNITLALISFRTAKALKTNGTTRERVPPFRGGTSVRFEGSSEQLLRLGMIDPGQWF
jgi:hypothetical protein